MRTPAHVATSPFMTTQLISTRDAAQRLGVAVRTIYALHERGALGLVKLGRRSLVRLDDLAALVERQTWRRGRETTTAGRS